MPTYAYFARTREGAKIQRTVEADSLGQLGADLKRQGLVLISAREHRGAPPAAGRPAAGAPVRSGGRIKVTDIAFFFRQMATMVAAGVAINDALRELGEQTQNLNFAGLIEGMRSDIERGQYFSQSLLRHPRYFPALITSMVAAGEEGGNLAGVLEQISVYLEDKLALQREVKAATTYPILIGGFLVLALLFVTFFLIPRFREMFEGFGVTLPLLTRVVLGASSAMFRAAPYALGLSVPLALALRRAVRTPGGRRALDRLKFRLPLVGPTMHLVALSYFCQTFAALLTSGVTVIKCLDIVGRVSGNMVIEEATARIRDQVINGNTLSGEMKREPVFTALLSRMVAVGEQTGQLGDMFVRVNRFYRDEALTKTRMLTVTLEPVMLVSLGIIVGIVVVAMYLPIFMVSGAMKM